MVLPRHLILHRSVDSDEDYKTLLFRKSHYFDIRQAAAVEIGCKVTTNIDIIYIF